jgi:biopolymer transport protein ExbD
MNWQKLKKVIIPLIIIKIIILVFFILKSEFISISREITYSDNFQQGTESDSIVQKKQRLIRIVRNEEERGIIIKLRGKKNSKPFPDKKRELYNPIVE